MSDTNRKPLHDLVISDGDAILKAHFIGEDAPSQPSNAIQETGSAFASIKSLSPEGDVIEPPFDPERLCRLFENSNSLRQNVDAIAVNVEGFGHRFDPVIDLEADDADAKLSDALYLQKLEKAGANVYDSDESELDVKEPSPEETKKFRERMGRAMRIERAKLNTFFTYCAPRTSFVALRKITRQDLEVTGNSYWEVLRDADGHLTHFVHMPSFTMRLCRADTEHVLVEERIKNTDFSYTTRVVPRLFRRCVQTVDGYDRVYFKEFGDTRLMSRLSGRYYADVATMLEEEPKAKPATEVIHFKIPSPISPYGVPRWIGVLMSVLGSRSAEEINYMYFENKSVPPLALIVSGGRLADTAIPRLQDYIENRIRGKKNFHSILIVEAEDTQSAAGTGKARIELKPLTNAQQKDELFQNYDERNIDKVGGAFRLPRMLRGDIRDFNKSTAEAALMFAEMQVFQPERDDFDFMVNRQILPEMNIRYWVFRTQAPTNRDPTVMAEAVRKLVNAGILTPEEGRQLAGEIFNREFKKISEDWVTKPLQVVLAEMNANQAALEAQEDPDAGNRAPAKANKAGDAAKTPGKQSKKKVPTIQKGLEFDDTGVHFNQESGEMTIRVSKETIESWMVRQSA